MGVRWVMCQKLARRISTNMDERFPDVTDEEIDHNDNCVICRDSLFEGSKPKKLTCGHIFHVDCLRSWIVIQQVCPTCRAEIPADGPLARPTTQVFGDRWNAGPCGMRCCRCRVP